MFKQLPSLVLVALLASIVNCLVDTASTNAAFTPTKMGGNWFVWQQGTSAAKDFFSPVCASLTFSPQVIGGIQMVDMIGMDEWGYIQNKSGIALKVVKNVYYPPADQYDYCSQSPAEWFIISTDYLSYAILYSGNDALRQPATVAYLVKNLSSITNTTITKFNSYLTTALAKYNLFNTAWMRNVTQGSFCGAPGSTQGGNGTNSTQGGNGTSGTNSTQGGNGTSGTNSTQGGNGTQNGSNSTNPPPPPQNSSNGSNGTNSTNGTNPPPPGGRLRLLL